MEQNPYVELTAAFNTGRLRAVLSSGQAVVMHRLAVMSKDGDWILRGDDEALEYVLKILGERGARYRFGAPLDRRWLAAGWSAHLEHRVGRLRLRRDLMHRNEERLLGYREAAQDWAAIWPAVAAEVADLPLSKAHELIVARAESVLPQAEPSRPEKAP